MHVADGFLAEAIGRTIFNSSKFLLPGFHEIERKQGTNQGQSLYDLHYHHHYVSERMVLESECDDDVEYAGDGHSKAEQSERWSLKKIIQMDGSIVNRYEGNTTPGERTGVVSC